MSPDVNEFVARWELAGIFLGGILLGILFGAVAC